MGDEKVEMLGSKHQHGRSVADFERHFTFDSYDGPNPAGGPDW